MIGGDGRLMRYVGPRQIVIDGNPVIPLFWEPDHSFAGETVALVGGGPSHADIDLSVLSGHRFVAINSACRKVRPIATQSDLLYFTDNAWNENRPELARDWPGPVVTANRNAKIRLGDAVRYIDVAALTGAIGAMSDFVQASSGHIAACLVAIMGAHRIVLIGFEAQSVNGRTHGHRDYDQQDMGAYVERFLPGWRNLAPAFKRRGIDVVNATPNSAIVDFRFASFADAICESAGLPC